VTFSPLVSVFVILSSKNRPRGLTFLTAVSANTSQQLFGDDNQIDAAPKTRQRCAHGK
jgi:hypothetical protein